MMTEEDEAKNAPPKKGYPQKKYFRSRAHCNPLSNNDGFWYPVRPSEMDWAELYSGGDGPPRVLDVGCGFGGLSVSLAKIAPSERILALEIRPKVCEFVRRRIESLRASEPGGYGNVACLRSNAMLHLPNMIRKGQLSKIFFCFPDPHFKAKNHRRRVVSDALLAEYAFLLRPGGLLFAITDVRELHDWHLKKLHAHVCFEPVEDLDPATDPYVKAMVNDTEEGLKVSRNNGDKFWCVFRRRRILDLDRTPLFTPSSESVV